jgi:hypothetical protein
VYYRAYSLNEKGNFTSVEILADCGTDAQATAAARKLLDGSDIEVWNLGRKVVFLKGDGSE